MSGRCRPERIVDQVDEGIIVRTHCKRDRPGWRSLPSPGIAVALTIGILSIVMRNAVGAGAAPGEMFKITGRVIDADAEVVIPSRIYIQNRDTGSWHFAKSAVKIGSAVRYEKDRGGSVEMHTTLSAHPFVSALPAGRYTITAERGKEYHTGSIEVSIENAGQDVIIPLTRWIDMAERGWYSGDTHVHRPLAELANVLPAEDLNVAFPLSYWVREAFAPPVLHRETTSTVPDPVLVKIDDTHVYYPMNTEYEIFKVGGARHTLGAVFVLNHNKPLTETVPPVGPILRPVRDEGALLELDKHNWPWSMMLVPILDVDLFELSNNHVWRTKFLFSEFGVGPGAYMNVETDAKGFTERGWIEYGFQNYYTLLNCGFAMTPTAGTASGVHPVPLGFGRVYVELSGGFDYAQWLDGLKKGRSFVTTGPMLFSKIDGKPAGHHFIAGNEKEYDLEAEVISPYHVKAIEIIVNGEIRRRISPGSENSIKGAYKSEIHVKLAIDETSWVAVRCFAETPDGRVRFAHSAPFHFEVRGKPLRARKVEIEYLMQRVQDQIDRSAKALPQEALAEYRRALKTYEDLLVNAR